MTALSVIALSALLSAPQELPHGRYVEARSASVFAGACHYNGEYVTQGREAVLAWSFEGGRFAGVELGGLQLAVLLAGSANLAEPAAAARAIAFVPEQSSPAQRAALLGWFEQHGCASAARVLEVRAVPLELELRPESFALRAGSGLALSGDALANRACCKMPYNVWYAPFEALTGRLVGHVDAFRCSEPGLALEFERRDENSAFFGSFGAEAPR